MNIPGTYPLRKIMMKAPSPLKGVIDHGLLEYIDDCSRMAIKNQGAVLYYTEKILNECARNIGSFYGCIPLMGDKDVLTLGVKRYWSPTHKRYWHISLFRFKKGESHPFHLHENISALHLTVKGLLRSFEYDVEEEGKDSYRLTGGYRHMDGPGEGYATALYHRNAHWFDALEDDTYFLIYSLRGVHGGSKGPARRVYLAPITGGMGDPLIIARRTLDREEAMIDGPTV